MSFTWIKRLFFLASLPPAYCLGTGLPIVDSVSLLKDLATAAAVVFAVLGAWIALIYPDAAKALQTEGSDHTSQTDRAKRLLGGVIQCSVVLTVSIFFPILVKVAKSYFELSIICGLSFCLVYLCSLSVLSALWSSIFVGDTSFVDMVNARKRRDALNLPFADRTRKSNK